VRQPLTRPAELASELRERRIARLRHCALASRHLLEHESPRADERIPGSPPGAGDGLAPRAGRELERQIEACHAHRRVPERVPLRERVRGQAEVVATDLLRPQGEVECRPGLAVLGQELRQAVEAARHARVVGAERALDNGQGALVEPPCTSAVARPSEHVPEPFEPIGKVDVVRAEPLLRDGDRALVERARRREVARLEEQVGERGEIGGDHRMVAGQHLLIDREGALVEPPGALAVTRVLEQVGE
jgi:hypothetical protein